MIRLSISLLGLALLSLVSCTPMGASNNGGTNAIRNHSQTAATGSTIPVGTAGSGARATSGDLRNIREQRQTVGSGGSVVGSGGASSDPAGGEYLGTRQRDSATTSGGDISDYPATLPPIKIDYPYALPVPGRKGWVYAPESNRPVNVRGVASGKLVYDERDPANRNPDGTLKPVSEMPHKFRVP